MTFTAMGLGGGRWVNWSVDPVGKIERGEQVIAESI